MEAIGAASSLFTVIQVVNTVAQQGRNIISQYKHAPAQLHRVTNLVTIVHSQLTIISHLQKDIAGTHHPLLPDDAASLNHVLKIVAVSFDTIQKGLESQCTKSGIRARLKWALWDHTKSADLELRLQQDENCLHTVLQLISVRLLHLSLGDTASIKNYQQLILQNVVEIRHGLLKAPPDSENMGEDIRRVSPNSSENSDLSWWSWSRYTDPQAHNSWLRAAISAYGNKFETNYWFILRTYVPCFAPQLAIFFEAKLRSYALQPLGLSLPFVNLSIRNIVPETSPLLEACLEGKLGKVISLFDRRKGSPNDVSPNNTTPLKNAIQSGSLELVQYLLMVGAQADTPFGCYQTSPLQWAIAHRQIEIARLLLAKGACCEHISLRGWSPIFYLYGGRQTQSPSTEYLDMIFGGCFTGISVQDTEGWTCLHRAAAFGSASDIEKLIKFGASTSFLTDRMEWTPNFCAVQFGNVSTFTKLQKYMDPAFLEQRDVRGWTMLHVAANTGNLDTMTLLIKLGADPLALTEPSDKLVPAGLESRTLSVAQIALNKGREAVTAFVNALRASHWDIAVPFAEEEEDEVFWPAKA